MVYNGIFRNIKWAPIFSISLERRLQTLTTGLYTIIIAFGPIIVIFAFLYYTLFGNFLLRLLCVLYIIRIVSEKNVAYKGGKGNGNRFVRGCFLWNYIIDYFPVNIVKTVDLPPNRNYLFATSPHGVASCGVVCNFVSYRSNFQKLFPGIRTRVCTLNINSWIPFFRELFFAYGMATASEYALKSILDASNDPTAPENSDGFTSNAVILVVGGAKEALNARPNNYQIEIRQRKGFVRLAIMTGSPLVPVFSFGEVDIFDQVPNPPGSRIRNFQEYVKKIIGLAPTFFVGRGFLQNSFGFVPYRKPITTVVGGPIEVVKNEKPTQDEIEKYHKIFLNALIDLFEKHKHNYVNNYENVKLIY